MKNTYELFLKTIKCGVGEGDLPTDAEWGKVFALAKHHGLTSMFYNAVKDAENVPADIKTTAKTLYLAQTAQQMAQEYYAEAFFDGLKARGIRYMPLKGYVLRKLYPTPEHRTSCDVDVFYDKNRKTEMEEILTSLGFINKGDSINHGEWVYQKVTLETHHELAAQKDLYHEYYKDVWARLKTEDGVRYDFTDEDFYVYFLEHGAKHFTLGGFGVRTVLDVYIYNKEKKLDREYLQAELDKLGLLQFALALERLSRVWFGEETEDEETERLGEYIFESGTYGTEQHLAIKRGLDEGDSAKKAKRTYFRKTVFPPLSTMKNLYPVLNKAPFLLPFAWVYKWCEILLKRRKRVKVVMKNMQSFEEEKMSKSAKVMDIVGFSKK